MSRLLPFVLLVTLCPALFGQSASEDDVAELKAQLAELRAAMEELKAEKDEDDRVSELARRLEILAEEVEKLRVGEAAHSVEATEGSFGLGIAASKVYGVEQGLSIGGYGEMLFESFASDREDGSPSGREDQADFLRAVFYFGYKFTDRWVFNSEIEIEHGSTSTGGSTSVEFAYVDYLWKPQLNVRSGMVLVPMGFVNELHEPPMFWSAERPRTETAIIPSTWRENGVGVFGDVGPFSYRTYVVNGLRGERFGAGGLRGGRQKGGEAIAEDLAWTGRLDYTGRPGLLIGASAYVGDSGQGIADEEGVIGARTTIFDLHADWNFRGLKLRGLFARAELDDAARLNDALGLVGAESIGEELEGYYLEAGYDLLARRGGRAALIPFVRFESLDTQLRVPRGFARNAANDADIVTYGVAFKPIDQLIFKLDVQDWSNGARSAIDQWNLALGYLF